MYVVHTEDVVGRSKDDLAALCKNHGLEHVHDLGDVCHCETVSMTVEDVERHRSDHRVTHCVLLIEMARVCAWLYIEPCSPLVEKKVNLSLRVICVHDSLMVLDHFLDLDRLCDHVVPAVDIELCCRAL